MEGGLGAKIGLWLRFAKEAEVNKKSSYPDICLAEEREAFCVHAKVSIRFEPTRYHEERARPI